MLSIYPACFFKEDTGSYSVIFPDLNHLATCGETIDEAMEMAIDAMAGYLYTCKKDGDTIPKPSSIKTVDLAAVAHDAYDGEVPKESFVNMVSVDVNAYAKEHFEKSVRKTLTIPAWLNTAALEKGINFSQTLQEALMLKVQAH